MTRPWGELIGDAGEVAGWFAGQAVAPLLQATAPARFGDWVTDRGARRLRFYDGEELRALGRAAGFEAVQVERRSLERFAREAGVAEEALPLFAGEGPRFPFARKG